MTAVKSSKRLEKLYQILASKGFALGLFGAGCIVFIALSAAPARNGTVSRILSAVLVLVGLNVLLCTFRRINTLSKPVLIIHSGVMLSIIGGIITSFGFVATVNLYEGARVDQAYRWDKKADAPLGFTLAVTRIHTLYYPIPVKIGVLKGKEKVGLFTLKTGEHFTVDSFKVIAEELEFHSESLRLSVFQQGRFIGSAETPGTSGLPPDFPYSFVLVAYKDPVVQRAWIDMMLTRGTEVIAEGTSEVNSPFQWNGLCFYHTRTESDPYGMAYAGIQIVRDPGTHVVFLGFIVITIGSLFWMYRKSYGYH